ncbi:hypothetical protein MUP77_22090 [Candidatus Bathyarchaeota archaeon]|nr:hypothetical protein [Candidatus Bathyarchaeota archaeon]
MRSKKNYETGESQSAKLCIKKVPYNQDPVQRGLRMLARMIAQAYLEEIDQKRLVAMGVRPLYIEKIQIVMNSTDLNNPKEETPYLDIRSDRGSGAWGLN